MLKQKEPRKKRNGNIKHNLQYFLINHPEEKRKTPKITSKIISFPKLYVGVVVVVK